ncbi:unnamed protein product [Heligmosomoides polygyrus]|uniref:LsmAD domain-containing protein n=1 Tax=Heligmosomoides polygyrus TaxID=6339 RepID=A0A183GCR7_HELPZ|nr:unnamed protein product [Heligmosomoides polygyrus]
MVSFQELFGGGSSPFGTTSVFDRITQQRETGGFHRKNVLEKEMQQYTEWEAVKHPPAKAPFFSEVEDHNQAYERARKRGNWRSTGSQLHQVAEPGPEIFEDASSGSEQPIESTDASEREALSLEDNWNEAAENVLATPTLSEEEKQRMMESEPGPDLGDDEVRLLIQLVIIS